MLLQLLPHMPLPLLPHMLLPLLPHMLLPLLLDTPELLPPQLSTPTLLLDTDTTESVRLRPSPRLMLTLLARLLLDSPLLMLMPLDMLMLFPPTPPDTTTLLPHMDMLDVLAMLVL